MKRLHKHFFGLLFTCLLSGCGVISVMDVAVLGLSAPGPGNKRTIELPEGFSLKPSSTEHVADLLVAAIPSELGNVYFTGQVEWTGLSGLKQSVFSVNQSMSAITDNNLLFLWWSEDRERYEVLIRLPFEDIYSIELWTPGFGTNIRFCHEKDEVPFGVEALQIDRNTTLRVLKSSAFIDKDRTREVFLLLEGLFPKKKESRDLPNPCDQATTVSEEPPKEFGHCSSTVEEC